MNSLRFLCSLPDASGKSLLREFGFGSMLSLMVASSSDIIMQAIRARVITTSKDSIILETREGLPGMFHRQRTKVGISCRRSRIVLTHSKCFRECGDMAWHILLDVGHLLIQVQLSGYFARPIEFDGVSCKLHSTPIGHGVIFF